jgi:hypothetical protein
MILAVNILEYFNGLHSARVAHSTKKATSGKDSVIEGQPLLVTTVYVYVVGW